MQSILKCILDLIIINISCDLLSLELISKNQATLRQILPVDENEAPLEVKKDNKYYNTLRKQKPLAKRSHLDKVRENFKLKSMVADISPPTALPAAVSVNESIPVSFVAIPLFAIGDLISIIPDTSQRVYKSIKVIGLIISINQSAGGIYLYDFHKAIDTYVR